MLVENYSNSRSRLTHSAVEAIFSDLRVDCSQPNATVDLRIRCNANFLAFVFCFCFLVGDAIFAVHHVAYGHTLSNAPDPI